MKATQKKKVRKGDNVPAMQSPTLRVLEGIRHTAKKCADEDRSVGYRLVPDEGEPRELAF